MKSAGIALVLSIMFLDFAVAQTTPSDSLSFQPDGVYSPMTRIQIETTIVNCFQIKTFEYAYNEMSKNYYLRSLVPSVSLFFTTRDGLHCIAADNVRVSRDTLSFRVSHPSFGVVIFQGTFLDKSGHYTSSEENPFKNYAVVQGRIRIVQGSTARFDKTIRWTYSDSDDSD